MAIYITGDYYFVCTCNIVLLCKYKDLYICQAKLNKKKVKITDFTMDVLSFTEQLRCHYDEHK